VGFAALHPPYSLLALTTQNNVGLDFCGSNGAGDQTSATAISPDGASRYLVGDCGVNHTAYLYDWDMNLTTPVVYPAAKSTYVTGVNAGGLTVGSYATTGGVTHGFYLIGSLYVTFDPPGATTTNTWGISINNAIYGNYAAGGSVSYGFLLREGGTYTTLNPANSIATVVTGLNAANEAAGFYVDSALREHAFWWVNGGFGTISLGSNSVAAGINQAGQMAGTYWDTSGVSHGFVVDTLGSTYITFNAPTGATGLVVTGVNNTHAGVSGYYQKGGKTVGFLALCEGKGCY